MKRIPTLAAIAGALVLALSMGACAGETKAANAAHYNPGTYEASGQGNNGEIRVAVTFTQNAIKEIRIVKHEETPGISDPAFKRIPEAITKSQSLAVDTVSGATHVSEGIIEAVAKAVVLAGGDPAALKGVAVRQAASPAVSKTADVVIVGGGGAGMAAAASAAEKGAKVILIEKTAALGGNTLASGCAWNAVDPEIQGTMPTLRGQIETLKAVLDMDGKDFGDYAGTLATLKGQIRTYLAGDTSIMFDSVEWHMIQAYLGGKRQDRSGHWYSGKFELVRKLCSESLPTIKWAESLGVVFSPALSAPVGSMWTRGHNPVDKMSFFNAPSKYLLAHGGEIMLETKATSLIVEKGRVVGVEAVKADGGRVTLRATKGVILATGGYGANAAMVKEYNDYWPSIPADMKCTCVASATGDGVVMGKAAGASLVGMQFTQLMPTAHAVTGQLADGILVPPQNYVFVNQQGKRFVNEYAERDVLSFAALSQTDGIFYHIADTTMALNANNKPSQATLDKMVAKGILYRADTVEELAKLIKVDPAALAETVRKYNACVDAGKDPEFGKNVGLKIQDAPFYAVPEKPAIHHTMGGIEIDAQTRALAKNGKPIPGLYAAGEVTGGIHAGNRLGGNSIADIWVYGRTAGASAAAGL
jgi:fumarate reductase flavoprotein subunit